MTNDVVDRPIQRALISTTDKNGLVDFALKLVQFGVEIVATGGTARFLEQHHIPVIQVSDYTGFPEILGGRVKTLHPKIHGGLLFRRGADDEVIAEYGIKPIDLLVINLYPFEQTIEKPSVTHEEAIEQIDVGGPSLLRAAAKNFKYVTAVIDSADYSTILFEMNAQDRKTSLETRQRLAQKTFAYLSRYDSVIADYLLHGNEKQSFPLSFSLNFRKKMDLRYGENPHQHAALYVPPKETASLAEVKPIQGKPLSYNNFLDADCAYRCVNDFCSDIPACVIVKHATPCGVAQAETQLIAYEKAYSSDPLSAYGGIIAFNTPVDVETAKKVIAQQFVEVIVAPDFTLPALHALVQKPNISVLPCTLPKGEKSYSFQTISGGVLVQDVDASLLEPKEMHTVTERQPTVDEMTNLLFAWTVVKFVKSNAIVYARDRMTLGIGGGQTSRVFAAKIAILKAKEANLNLQGAVMASDAFFPFSDSIDLAAQLGITAIIQPGGSKQDAEVIATANKANIAMVFTHQRHFRH